jgi:triphosphatase
MFETELKFQVPAARAAAVRKAVATSTAVQTRLQALYVETTGHDLAAAGLALRLRKEGRVWVQTLKGRGDGLMQRLEHEVRLPPQSGLPTLDPARHDGSAAGVLLRAALARAREAGRPDELRVLYRTDIRRTLRRVRHGGAWVELALDEGQILADGPPAAQGEAAPPWKLPVCELEFELISGPDTALAEIAARWVARHGLWWDVRTKSERGFRLALQRHEVPAVRAGKQVLPPGEALAPALAAMLQAALAQALPNLAEIAGATGPRPAAPEHLHQLRVGIRRLRSALHLFAAWGGDEAAPALTLESRWREVFAALGAARDADVLAATWMPRLAAAGAPPLPPALAATPAQAGCAPQRQLQSAGVSVLLLDTLALSLRLAQAPQLPAKPVSRQAAAREVLRAAWKRAWRDAAGFAGAPVPQQHRARKRLKRLRYALEFVTPLLPPKPLKRWHGLLAEALQALGDYNDLQTARGHYDALILVKNQPETALAAAWAAGWLAAHQPGAAARAVQALAALKAAPVPWKPRSQHDRAPKAQR